MFSFTVTIPTHRRPHLLSHILDTLDIQATALNILLEILVIYSHNDDLPANLINYRVLTVNYLHSPNIIACKRNTGISYASSPALVFLDDDCIPSCDFVERITKHIPLLATHKLFSGHAFLSHQSDNYYRFRQYLLRRRQMRIQKQGFIDAASAYSMNFLAYRPFLLSLNLYFSESFTEYGWEDQYFFHQIIAHGATIHQGDQVVYHSVEPSFSSYCSKTQSLGRNSLSYQYLSGEYGSTLIRLLCSPSYPYLAGLLHYISAYMLSFKLDRLLNIVPFPLALPIFLFFYRLSFFHGYLDSLLLSSDS